MGDGPAAHGVTATILAQADALLAAPLPEDVIEWARQGVLDWFGVALAGASARDEAARGAYIGDGKRGAARRGGCGDRRADRWAESTERYDSYTTKVDLVAQRETLGRKFRALAMPM